MSTFEGRVALVTGAGSSEGIGFATALLLGRRGANVAIASTTERIHDRAAELTAEGVDASGHVADLTDPDQADRIVREVVERFGRVDVLVNNAGMVQTGTDDVGGPFVSLPPAAFERDLTLNLMTAVHVTRAVLPGMVANGYGRIVMVGSVTGPVVTNPESAGYSAAKAGMEGLMRAIALEVASSGITCNAVRPGWIETGSSLPPELVAGRNTPVGRPGRPQEVAEAIAFLAAEGASYITGETLVVDGGNTIQEFKGPSDAWY
jgi:3-oxoacyl-[acyl-carrier protein] reductase